MVSRHKRAHKVVTRACSDPCADFVVRESPRPRERRNKIKLCSSPMMTVREHVTFATDFKLTLYTHSFFNHRPLVKSSRNTTPD